MKGLNSINKKAVPILLIIIGLILLLLTGYFLINLSVEKNNGIETIAYIHDIVSPPIATEDNKDEYFSLFEDYQQILKEYQDLEIIDENTTVAIIIRYMYNEEIYYAELGYYSANFFLAQEIVIYVNPKDSSKFVYDSGEHFSIWLGLIVGCMLFFGGLISILIIINNKIAVRYMKKNGQKVTAKILYVDESSREGRFNKHPFKVTCVYIDEETKEEKFYVSDRVYARNAAITYINREINVFIDPQNDKYYYVDIELFEKE